MQNPGIVCEKDPVGYVVASSCMYDLFVFVCPVTLL